MLNVQILHQILELLKQFNSSNILDYRVWKQIKKITDEIRAFYNLKVNTIAYLEYYPVHKTNVIGSKKLLIYYGILEMQKDNMFKTVKINLIPSILDEIHIQLRRLSLSLGKSKPNLERIDCRAEYIFSIVSCINSLLKNCSTIEHTTWMQIFNRLMLLKYAETPSSKIIQPSKEQFIDEAPDFVIGCYLRQTVEEMIITLNNYMSCNPNDSTIKLIDIIILKLTKIKISKKQISKIHYINFTKQSVRSSTISMNNQGIRVRIQKDPELNIDEKDIYLDGSFGANNFQEFGRFTSGPSFDRMDDESSS